jgi:hypothetical protein
VVRCPYCGQECEFLTAEQVGQLLGWKPNTVRRKINQGLFPGAVFVQGIHKTGMWRVPISTVLPLLEGRNDGAQG